MFQNWYTSFMELNFEYSRDKDVWCLLNKGKSSNNSSNPTKVYKLLVEKYGEAPTASETTQFIETYLQEHNVAIDEQIEKYSADWQQVADEYKNRAENVFDVDLPSTVTAYLTVNNRNPYSIENNMFYVSTPRETVRKTIMHELWHFYTWYGLGIDQKQKLGASKYNELKEALTVLLNVECADLFPEGECDSGYPQHQELRSNILDLWKQNNDIKALWQQLT